MSFVNKIVDVSQTLNPAWQVEYCTKNLEGKRDGWSVPTDYHPCFVSKKLHSPPKSGHLGKRALDCDFGPYVWEVARSKITDLHNKNVSAKLVTLSKPRALFPVSAMQRGKKPR